MMVIVFSGWRFGLVALLAGVEFSFDGEDEILGLASEAALPSDLIIDVVGENLIELDQDGLVFVLELQAVEIFGWIVPDLEFMARDYFVNIFDELSQEIEFPL